jgi:hypothetical protein
MFSLSRMQMGQPPNDPRYDFHQMHEPHDSFHAQSQEQGQVVNGQAQQPAQQAPGEGMDDDLFKALGEFANEHPPAEPISAMQLNFESFDHGFDFDVSEKGFWDCD